MNGTGTKTFKTLRPSIVSTLFATFPLAIVARAFAASEGTVPVCPLLVE